MGSSGPDTKRLQEYLGLVPDGNFGPTTLEAVKEFQSKNGLTQDGIVGMSTWSKLYKPSGSGSISWGDYDFISYLLDCDIAAIKAVQEVETAGRSGFLSDGRPMILFEGHIFWKQLKAHGIDPHRYERGNSDILYPTWTKAHYLGGAKEYLRLDRASKIHMTSALESASWGMFQIMGLNYGQAGCVSVEEFVGQMKKGQYEQLLLFAKFIGNSPKLKKALGSHDWESFAKLYNGPGYKSNSYDSKLLAAYKKFKV